MNEAVVLRMRDVRKSYPGVTALKGVSFSVRAGKVHALLGENGAGKSTLMSIAAGAERADSGTVEIDGEALADASPAVVADRGLAVVYQHPAILDHLAVWENMVLAMPASSRPPWREGVKWAQSRLDVIDARINPRRLGSDLSAAEREMVEIAKALALEPKVLVLDEPTAVLNAQQTVLLFDQVRRVAGEGAGVVYITHRIPEIRQIADQVTVLRDGTAVGTFDLAGTDDAQILHLVTGKQSLTTAPHRSDAPGEVALKAEGLSGEVLSGVSVDVQCGEILGLGGVSGNGQEEFIRCLGGLERHGGLVTVTSSSSRIRTAADARGQGVIYVPGDRQKEGVFSSLSVRENVAAQTLADYATAGLVRGTRERSRIGEVLTDLSVRMPGVDSEIYTLSGGNQQKALFARALLARPTILLCDEPTQGVDVGARAEIHRLLREQANSGLAVVVLSTDAAELAEICDRVLVFSRGHVARELTGSQISEKALVSAAMTATFAQRRAETSPSRWTALSRVVRGSLPGNVSRAPLALAGIVLVIGALTASSESAFLGSLNLSYMFFLAAALIFAAVGQLIVMLTGGIDLSVGPVMALTTVILSFFETQGSGPGRQIAGYVLVLAAGTAVGVLHGVLVRKVKMPPIIVTVATFIGLQGVALLIRPTPGGEISLGLSDTLQRSFGFMPFVFAIALAVAGVAEFMLRRSTSGVALRAIGSSETSAYRVGIKPDSRVITAYVLCSLIAVLAGLLLFAQVGNGDPSAGINYSLDSITAVILGGASIYGGRGSFAGAVLAAILLTEILNVVSFLNLNGAWQYWLPGILVLAGGAFFARRSSRHRLAAT